MLPERITEWDIKKAVEEKTFYAFICNKFNDIRSHLEEKEKEKITRCKNPQCNRMLDVRGQEYCANSHCEFQSPPQRWKPEEVLKKVEEMKGLAKNPDFYITLKRRMHGNIYTKDVSEEAITHIGWEARDMTLDEIKSLLQGL